MSCCALPCPSRNSSTFMGAEELGRVYQADLMINATMPAAARRLATLPRLTLPAPKPRLTRPNAALADWRSRREIPGRLQLWMCSSI